MTPLEAAWQAVLASPQDERARRVLADAMIEAGDPHGEFIALQLAPAVDPDAIDRHLAKNAARLLGSEERLFHWSPRFSRGFIAEAGPIGSAPELERLLSLPIGRLLERLQVELDPADVERAVRESPPGALQELVLRVSPERREASLGLRSLLEALPRLQRLLDFHATVDLQGAHSESLRALSLLVGAQVLGLGAAKLPALDTLVLTLPFRRVDLDAAFLEGEVAPKLKTLVLFGALWPSQLQTLAASEVLKRLKRLDLMTVTDTGWYPVLIRNAAAFSHLEQLNVRPDAHHPDWVTTVRTVLPNVRLVTAGE